MRKKEAQRLAVVGKVLDGQMAEAKAEALNRSVRQVKRLVCRLGLERAVGLISRRRGVPSNGRIDAAVREYLARDVGVSRPARGPSSSTRTCLRSTFS